MQYKDLKWDSKQKIARIQAQIGHSNRWALEVVEIEVIHLRTDAQMQGMLCLEDGTKQNGIFLLNATNILPK